MSYNPDTTPSYPIQRGLIFGAKCPISHTEFLNLTEGAIDDTIRNESLVALQKAHTHGIIVAQDAAAGRPRDLSVEDRRKLWLSENPE